jgi:hypothetical protein
VNAKLPTVLRSLVVTLIPGSGPAEASNSAGPSGGREPVRPVPAGDRAPRGQQMDSSHASSR